MIISTRTEHPPAGRDGGFTLIEVVVAAVILSIVVVGTFAVYTHAVRVNRGNNLRAQALTVLQAEIEYYRGLRFVPVGSSTALNAGTYPNLRTRTSADGRVFNISVAIVNIPVASQTAPVTDADARYKEITVTAVPVITETGWLSNLGTSITVQRVRSN